MKFKNTRVYGLKESVKKSGYAKQLGEPETLDDNDLVITEKDFRRGYQRRAGDFH